MQLDAPESPESSDMQEIHSLGVYQSSDTQISKSDMKTITGSSYHVSENIFFMGKRSSPPVRVFNRRCWCPHHQRFQIRTSDVDVPITNGSGTGGDGPAITNELNPTVPKTVGDAFLEPAVIGVAVVVNTISSLASTSFDLFSNNHGCRVV